MIESRFVKPLNTESIKTLKNYNEDKLHRYFLHLKINDKDIMFKKLLNK